MFGLFKKSDKQKVDAAEMERQEREQRKKELAAQMKQTLQGDKEDEQAPSKT